MISTSRRKRSLAAPAVVIASLLVAACGDDDDTTTPTAAESATTSAAGSDTQPPDSTAASAGTVTEESTSEATAADPGEVTTVKIGLLQDLSGPIEPFGRKVVEGATLAVEEFNEASTNIQVELVEADTASDPANAAPGLRELASDSDVVAVLGTTSGTAMVIAAPVAKEQGVTLLSPTSTVDYEEGVLNEWTYRAAPIAGQAYPTILEEVQGILGFETVAVFYDPSNASSQNEVDLLNELQDEVGFEIVATETAAAGQTDLSGIVSNIASSGADSVYISHADISVSSAFMVQARERGYEGDFWGGAPFTNIEIFELAGEAAEGALTFVPFLASAPENADFTAAYTDRWGRAPDVFGAEGHAGTSILLNGISSATEVTREGVREAVAATAAFPTVLGEIAYDGGSDNVTPTLVYVRVEDSQFVPI